MTSTEQTDRAALVAELDELYGRYGWTNEATDTWHQHARGWADLDRVQADLHTLRGMVAEYEAAETGAQRVDYGGTTVIHDLHGDSWLEVYLHIDDIRDVLTAALAEAAHIDDGRPDDLVAHIDAIRRVYDCCDPLGMPQLDDGAWVWCVDADAMWTLTTAPGLAQRAAAVRVRACLLHAMPELGLTGGRDTALDDQRVLDSIAAQLGGEATA